MSIKRLILAFASVFISSCAHRLPDFSTQLSVRLPIESRPEAIGEYSLGCLRGAETFSGKEKGVVLSQIKRGRYWGHPDLIKLITRAGEEFYKSHKSIMVGDLSLSRGGPTLTGHNSHQTGLDVDIWFKVLTNNELPSFRTSETEDMKPFEHLGDDQIKLIQYFFKDPAVERIFINPKLKKKLCSGLDGLKLHGEELNKLRAWWGHDDHIHVRLKCPNDSPLCVSQAPIPTGDGCGNELNWWFTDEAISKSSDESWNEMKSVYLEKVKKLPAQCEFYKDSSL